MNKEVEKPKKLKSYFMPPPGGFEEDRQVETEPV